MQQILSVSVIFIVQIKRTYLIFLLAVLLYPTAYQFLHIFPHQHHQHFAGKESSAGDNHHHLTEKQDEFICHIYDFQYSVNEIIQLSALLPFRSEIIAKLSPEHTSVLQSSSLRLSDSRAPPITVI